MKPNPTIKNNLVIMQFQPSKSFKFLRRKFGAKVRSGRFGLSGVPNMIGFTTILAKTQPFVIHVWELNMKTNFCLARNRNQLLQKLHILERSSSCFWETPFESISPNHSCYYQQQSRERLVTCWIMNIRKRNGLTRKCS